MLRSPRPGSATCLSRLSVRRVNFVLLFRIGIGSPMDTATA